MTIHKKDFEQNTFDDPFDTLSDDEFEEEITRAMEERVQKGLPIEKVGETVSISMRMDRSVLRRIKAMAKDQDVPYQRLMKTWIEDGLVATEREKVPTLRVALSDADIQRVTTTGIDILLVRENKASLPRGLGE
jgi:predicted DNA binding CopG/RHH family protein